MAALSIRDLIPDVSTRYGAPMGRRGYGTPEHAEPRTVRLFHVPLDAGGYDRGGAYWGTGARLWCATDGPNYRQFTRAASRARAALELGLTPEHLARPNAEDVLRYLVGVLNKRAPMPPDWKLNDVVDALQIWGAKTGRAAAAIEKLRAR